MAASDPSTSAAVPARAGFALGQERPRKAWLAALLSALVPGLGQLYCGRVVAALVAGLGPTLLALATFAAFVLGEQDLSWMLPSVRSATALVWVAQALHAYALAREVGEGYRLGKLNHPGAYLAFVGAMRLFAMLSGRAVGALLVLAPVEVSSDDMAPSIRAGDQVAAVRHGFDASTLAPGDVVLYLRADPAAGGDVPAVGRVVARGGQRVAFRGPLPVVDGTPLAQRPCDEDERARAAASFTSDVRVECRVERLGGVEHPILVVPPGVGDRPEVEVPEGTLFLVGDHRDRAKDSRALGPIPHDRVLGRVAAVVGRSGGGSFR